MKKRILTTMAIFSSAAILAGCSTSAGMGGYDRWILKNASEELAENPALYTADYNVKYNGNYTYTVRIQGVETNVQIPKPVPKESIGKNEQSITQGEVWEIFQKSKQKVIDYINNSEIVSNKEFLCNKIVNIPIKMVDNIDPMEDGVAFYDNGCVYVFRRNRDAVCEWMFVHELVHYLCELTNNVRGGCEYQGTDFTEAMTDIITASMRPKLKNNIESMYSYYYSECYQYIGIFGEDAIRAYFYGYSDIWKKVGKTEFDFWVVTFGKNMLENGYASNCVAVTLTKWQNVVLGR